LANQEEAVTALDEDDPTINPKESGGWVRRIIRLAAAVPLEAVLIAGAFVAAAVLWHGACASHHPSDKQMIAFFEDHREQFDESLEVFQASGSRGYSRTQLDVHSINGYDDGRVYFMVSAYGLISPSTKGYLYCPYEPTPLVGNTERDAGGPFGETYRHIDGDWYLYYHQAG